MIYQTRVQREMKVMHTVDGYLPCAGRVHPHSLIVSVSIAGDPQAGEAMQVASRVDVDRIHSILDEYADRDITPLMGASIPSVAGLTYALMERFAMIPGVFEVSIVQDWESEHSLEHTAKRPL